MCKEFRFKEYSGFCHCGRYYKVRKCPKVCLCGSTKFKPEFEELAKEFTKKGYIVEAPMVFGHCGDAITEKEKELLDEVHKSKIADCDLIFIVNKNGYIGKSTESEIEWAISLGKQVEYLED